MHGGEASAAASSRKPLSHATHGGEVGKIDAHSDVSHTFAETSKLNNKEFHKITKILSNKRMRFHLDNLIGQYDLNI